MAKKNGFFLTFYRIKSKRPGTQFLCLGTPLLSGPSCDDERKYFIVFLIATLTLPQITYIFITGTKHHF
jgi:hypothetical protein